MTTVSESENLPWSGSGKYNAYRDEFVMTFGSLYPPSFLSESVARVKFDTEDK